MNDYNPYSPADITSTLKSRDIRPSRRLGQNFLIDQGTAAKIANASGIKPGQAALEIGPGLGALTTALSLTASQVIAVEVDYRLAEIASNHFRSNPVVQIINEDFLKLDLEKLLERVEGTIRVVANIPYSITTPIIEKLFTHKQWFASISLLVQKEVADRLVASAGSGDYSSFSLFCNYHAETASPFKVARHLFHPRPEVESSLVVLTPIDRGLSAEEEVHLFEVIRAGFAQRRKRLTNAISHNLELSGTQVEEALGKLNKSPDTRAEELSLEDFTKLSQILFP